VEDLGLSENLKKVKAPAGLNINAITPDEIALSILAEITQLRRAGALSRENADV
jgi:xanthine dehydrogenase accessory factor